MQLARWWSLNNAENSSDFAFLGKTGPPSRSLDGFGFRFRYLVGELRILYMYRKHADVRHFGAGIYTRVFI